MCNESVLAGTEPRYKNRSRRGFNPGPSTCAFVNILRFAPTKEEESFKMDYSDSDRKVPATKKIPSRSVLTHLLRTSENARSYTSRALTPDQAPLLTHLLGTSKNARSYTSRTLAPDKAPVLTHLLGMSKNARSYTSRALALVRPSARPHAPSRDERERTIVHLACTRTSQTKRPHKMPKLIYNN
jgi:hypothetical protein